MNKESCGNCNFVKYDINLDSEMCHKNAPVEHDGTALWPPVPSSEWCGEWKSMAEAQKEANKIQKGDFIVEVLPDTLRFGIAFDNPEDHPECWNTYRGSSLHEARKATPEEIKLLRSQVKGEK